MNDQSWFPQYAPRPEEPAETLYPKTEAAEHRDDRDKFRPYFYAAAALALLVAIVGAFIVSFDQLATKAAYSDSAPVPSAEPGPPVPQPKTGTPATKPTEKSPPVAEKIESDGTWLVGREIKSGTYESDAGDSTCLWARVSSLSGEPEAAIEARYGRTGKQRVTIEPSDVAFQTNGCGQWVMVR